MFRRRDRREKADDTEIQADAPQAVEADEPEEFDELDDEEPGDLPEDLTADLESQAADYLADNDVWMYGPNAEAVLEILDRLEEIVPKEARPLAEAWLAIPKSDRERARKATRKLTENNEELLRYVQMAREAVGSWMAVTGPFPEFVTADPEWPRLCSQAGEAALDAATALILEDKLEEIHFESLLEPWSETMARLDAEYDAEELEGGPDEGERHESDEEEVEGKFGPNSDAIADFLNRLWLLTPEQVGRLVSGWQNLDRKDLKTAHESLIALVGEDPEYRDQVKKAQEELAPWLNAGRIQETSGFLGATGQNESRKMAGPTLADAAAALVLGDMLERSDAEILYGPWLNLIGAPPLPVAAASEEPKATVTTSKAPKATVNKTKAPKATAPTAAGGAKKAAAAAPKPVANQLSGAAKPNQLSPAPATKPATKSTTSGKSTKK
jgi:hypothetical protein